MKRFKQPQQKHKRIYLLKSVGIDLYSLKFTILNLCKYHRKQHCFRWSLISMKYIFRDEQLNVRSLYKDIPNHRFVFFQSAFVNLPSTSFQAIKSTCSTGNTNISQRYKGIQLPPRLMDNRECERFDPFLQHLSLCIVL